MDFESPIGASAILLQELPIWCGEDGVLWKMKRGEEVQATESANK
jgi:hypothetical protein